MFERNETVEARAFRIRYIAIILANVLSELITEKFTLDTKSCQILELLNKISFQPQFLLKKLKWKNTDQEWFEVCAIS